MTFKYLASNLPTWFFVAVNAVYTPLAQASMIYLFDIFIMFGFVATYRRQLGRIFKLYEENPPRVGQQAVDEKPFRDFLKGYMCDCYYNLLTAVAIVLANTVILNLTAVQTDVQRHFVLQALVVISMTHALSSLYLSLLYLDTLVQVTMSYAYTLTWTEGAMAASGGRWLNTAVVLATPSACSAGAIISFAAYRIVTGVIWMAEGETTAFASTDETNPYLALAVVCYMAFVITQTALVGKVFVGLKDAAVVPPVPSGNEDTHGF